MNKEINIVVIKVIDRIKGAKVLQKTLTEYSKIINTRLGLHELNDYKCSRVALIILELDGTKNECQQFIEKTQSLQGVIVETINFK